VCDVLHWIDTIRELLINFRAGIYPDMGTWSYVVLAVLVATEGPLSTLIGASASAAGYLDWRYVLLATVVGNVAGDCLWYSIGYMGKMEWLYEHGRWFGMRPHHVARLEREMRAHARKLIIFAKIAYGLIVPTLVAAGLARVPWRKWFPVVFLVETLWSILLVWIGFHTTAYIQDFEQTIHAIGVAVLVAVVVFFVMRFLRRRIDEQELVLDPLHQPLNQTIAEDTPDFPCAGVDDSGVEKEAVTVADIREQDVREYREGKNEIHRYVILPERERVR
jgi:membrane protein DedA with SNARE-associated domain